MAWLKPFGKKTPARGGAAALENDAAMERDPFAEETPEERKMRSRKKRTSDTVAGVLTWIVWAFIFLYSLTLIFLYGWYYQA